MGSKSGLWQFPAILLPLLVLLLNRAEKVSAATQNVSYVYCEIPPGGCYSLSNDAGTCSNYLGCAFREEYGLCMPRPTCNDELRAVECGMKGLIFEKASSLLPACARGRADQCDYQRQYVYDALGANTYCEDTRGSVPCNAGGCTLPDPSAQYERRRFKSELEFFVHPTRGWDYETVNGSWSEPFKTIHYAVERAREFSDVRRTITLMRGIHRVLNPVKLTPLDSGLTIKGDEGAVVSGAIQIKGLDWIPSNHHAQILVARIPDAIANYIQTLSALYINDEPAIRARYPNIQHFFDTAYAQKSGVQNWLKRTTTIAPVSNRIKVTIKNGEFGSFFSARGGVCEGMFEPPMGYFCHPSHEAHGGCPLHYPAGIEIPTKTAQELGVAQWALPRAYMHVFHPDMWGLWVFDFNDEGREYTPRPTPDTPAPTRSPTIPPPTNSPTTGAPTTLSPTMLPTTGAPSRSPTTSVPSVSPSGAPSFSPTTSMPSASPTGAPSLSPATESPSLTPTTSRPSTSPTTSSPSTSPTTSTPSTSPTMSPSGAPTTSRPSGSPTTAGPSTSPTASPSRAPTLYPTKPTKKPTKSPTRKPTNRPTTLKPTKPPTSKPSKSPTVLKLAKPRTPTPTKKGATWKPTKSPTTASPTNQPTAKPTRSPVTQRPSKQPTVKPTRKPTSMKPTKSPTSKPTKRPTTLKPTKRPTLEPTRKPTKAPTTPTQSPTNKPTTLTPTKRPTPEPTRKPTKAPTTPTQSPTKKPTTSKPSKSPTRAPTSKPTKSPTLPTYLPTRSPTTLKPSKAPVTPKPSRGPTRKPTRPTRKPTPEPTSVPSTSPIGVTATESDASSDRRQLQSKKVSTLRFGKGGFQEARGDCKKGGNTWFFENALPLLDSLNEFYLDMDDPTGIYLYYMPNVTNVRDPDAMIELTVNRVLFEVVGSRDNPVRDVNFVNLQLEKTYATHMDAHEMPSGGDWTVHRQGAILLEGVIDSSVYGSTFRHLGGNGVFVSKYARDIAIQRNTFYALAASAILLVGDPLFDSPQPYDRTTNEDHVERVLVSENLASDFGIVLKQSAGVFIAISRSIRVERNVIFNCPRAGIIFNDGFGGNTTVEHNIVFNTVRETLDHGPFNVWDRQTWMENPFVNPRLYPFRIVNNLFVGNQYGFKGVDLDDGAEYYLIEGNVLFDSYQKFKGNHLAVVNNLIYPHKKDGACLLLTPPNFFPANWSFKANRCILRYNFPVVTYNGAKSQVKPLCNTNNYVSASNTYYGPSVKSSKWKACGVAEMTYAKYTKDYKQEVDSVTFNKLPSVSDQVGFIKAMLDEWGNAKP